MRLNDQIQGLYLTVRLLSDLPIDELYAQISLSLPNTPTNVAYLQALTPVGAPEKTVRQRLSALACLLALLEEFLPGINAKLSLVRDEQGRPYAITEGSSRLQFDFNLSHTHTHAGCALLCGSRRVGLDLENMIPAPKARKLSSRFFTDHEKDHLAAMDDDGLFSAESTLLWTAKEAYAKQDGHGYPLDFDGCCLPSDLVLFQGWVSDTLGLSVCAPKSACPPVLGRTSLPVQWCVPHASDHADRDDRGRVTL